MNGDDVARALRAVGLVDDTNCVLRPGPDGLAESVHVDDITGDIADALNTRRPALRVVT